MKNEEEQVLYESVVYGWIGACAKLLSGISLTGVKLVEPELKHDEDIKKAETEYPFSVQVDFVDDGLPIGRVDLTRINLDKTLVQVILGALPDSVLLLV